MTYEEEQDLLADYVRAIVDPTRWREPWDHEGWDIEVH